MPIKLKATLWLAFLSSIALLTCPQFASAQFVAFWDHAPGTNQTHTHTNTSLGNINYALGQVRAIPLKNITNGASTGITLILTNTGLTRNAVICAERQAGMPPPGTPLYQNFYYTTIAPGTGLPTNYSYVCFGASGPESSVKLTDASLSYIFSGLHSEARYSFRAGAIRAGDAAYSNCWTLVELSGANSFTPAMSANVLTKLKVNGLNSNQVAVNFACNQTTGDMVRWDDIDPGPDGTFAIICTRYTGPVPGGSSDGTNTYGITGIRLEEKIFAKVQLTPKANGAVQVSWPAVAGVLQRSTNLINWNDCPLTNGEPITPSAKAFYRLRR